MLKELEGLSIDRALVNEPSLTDYKIPKDTKIKLSALLGELGYGFDTYTSYAITDEAKSDRPANYAIIPNQYFLYACKMREFAIELYKYFFIFEKLRTKSSDYVGSAEYILDQLSPDDFENREDMVLFSKFLDRDDSTFRLGSKRLINDEGKPRGSKDCFGSVVLKEINLPDNSSSIFGRLVYDLCSNSEVYQTLYDSYIESSKVITPRLGLAEQKYLSNEISKPFLLLAGISGTGKTRYVREQAKESGNLKETYCLTSVRPDWHEPSDLLGYVSRLSGHAEYVTTDVLRFIARAWRAIADADIAMSTAYVEGHGEQLLVTGDKSKLDNIAPYWLCLDEMNLAPVEQYFADYLSVLETREWTWEDGSFTYLCEPLLKATTFEQVADTGKLRSDLGFSDEKYSDVWALICQHGLSIPFNLLVAGTVNMDETTHGFSRKVIDRALSFDFGEFFPNDFDQFFEPSARHLTLSYPIRSQAKSVDCPYIDGENAGMPTVDFLKAVNRILKNTPFELAYRALNELLLAVVSQNPQNRSELEAVWDDFLMCKVLPRIEGDSDKLVKIGAKQSLLRDLNGQLSEALKEIWGGAEFDPSKGTRPDLHRENKDAEGVDKVIRISCRSRAKIDWMQSRLDSSGFTSFWP